MTLGPWTLLFSETLLTTRLARFQSTTQFALQRPLSRSVGLTLLSDATWRESSRRFDLSQTATLLWQAQDKTLVGLETGVIGVTEPDTVVTAWTLSPRLRYGLHRDWLLLEARPQVLFRRDSGFQPVPAPTPQLEAFFGAGYLPWKAPRVPGV